MAESASIPLSFPISITVERGGGNRLVAPEETLKALRLRPGTATRLRIGRSRLQVRIHRARPGGGADLVLGSRAFRIPSGWNAHLHNGEELAAGPVVGIMANHRGRWWGPQNTLFRRMFERARELGVILFLFTPGGVRFRSGRIWGYVHSGGGWRRVVMPFPDVVYDRTVRDWAVNSVQRRIVRAYGVRLFNTPLGSKWRQHLILRRDPELRRRLLATRPFRGVSDLAAIVGRYGGAYVKPSWGGKGIGIWRVERMRRGYRFWRTNRATRARGGRVSTLAGAARALRSRRPHVVQQRVDLLRVDGRIADVRALVQKDGTGVWRLTGAGVRVGRRGSIVSNLHGGGQALPLDRVLTKAFPPAQAAMIIDTIETAAMRTAERLDAACTCLGEVGIDFAVDRDGNVWFLEANSRTGRSLFRKMGMIEQAEAADSRPLEFAGHLAGFWGRLEPSVFNGRPPLAAAQPAALR